MGGPCYSARHDDIKNQHVVVFVQQNGEATTVDVYV